MLAACDDLMLLERFTVWEWREKKPHPEQQQQKPQWIHDQKILELQTDSGW